MTESLFQYYGIDFIGMCLTLVGIYQVGSKNKIGFVTSSVGNVLWIAFGVMTTSMAMIIVNIVIIALNTRGYVLWKR